MFKTGKLMFLALFLAAAGLLYNASALSAPANAGVEVAPAARVFAAVQDIPGFRPPGWLSDNQGRTWVEDLPLDTYIVFKLPQPLSRLLFQWMSSANYNYSETRYGAPKSYQIQISSDSTDGIDGKWVTAADIQNNLAAARAHEIKGDNIRWVRFCVTGGGTSIDEIDIHDLSLCREGTYPDTWGFVGDSITADSFWRDAATGKPFNERVNDICPERYPSMINLGIGGDNAKTLHDRLQHTIDLNPGVYFWAVGIGTNGSENAEQYEFYLRKIIQMLRENGKQPIVARIPYINIDDASSDSRIQSYNAVIDRLTAEYRLPSGPDLYTAFREHSGDSGTNSYYRDPYHPNADGVEAINRLWAEAACRLAVAGKAASEPEPARPSGKNKFTVEKTRIIGPDGSEFLIKGININGPGWCFPRDTLQDVRLIADVWQFNSVRLCAANKWDWFAADYNKDLDAIIKAFTDRGIVVILENHDYTGTYPSSTKEGGYDYEGNYLLPLSHLKSWWIDKAERFKNNPYVWFNIINEPGASADRQSAELWFALHDEIIGAIRDTGAENIIVADEHSWGQGGGYFGGENSYDSAVIRMGPELNRKYGNLVYSLHVYDAWADGGDRFERYFQDAKKRGLCVIIGEFGVMRGNAKQQSAVIAMYNSAMLHNIGRMYWAWDDTALPMTTEGCGWQIDRTDKTMPTNLTWAGELVWLDNRGLLSANLAIARPTASAVVVDGKNTAFDAYNIGGSNYFKLRDIAYVLSGTGRQFEVGWDSAKNAISLTSGAPYTPVGGELAKKAAREKTAAPTSSDIFLDGKQIVLTAYNIGGYNYFKLRDMGRVLDFGVDWDEARNTVIIDTSKK